MALLPLKPTKETHDFETWWRRLIDVATSYGVKVKAVDKADPRWRKFYDEGHTPGAAYIKALKRLKVSK
ncbi:TPA: hypothetical protein JG832_002508 [Enterobacter hormaechei subsp. xiangfangensis]|nr:hypothetical protein [Enterobacter hormaechei subsp. xiangfangensis]HAV1890643.1 hypothetical protein [Enterobacter hormaechei subsp. xiangfangensis]